jgi:hypothetical protein
MKTKNNPKPKQKEELHYYYNRQIKTKTTPKIQTTHLHKKESSTIIRYSRLMKTHAQKIA